MHGWQSYFVEAGYEVHLLTWHQPALPSRAEMAGVRVHYLPAQHLFSRQGLGRVRSTWAGLYIRYLVRRYGIGLVHAHQVIPYGFWAALSGVHPLVVSAWGSDLLTEPYASSRAMSYVKYTLARADLLTADSDHLRRAGIALGYSGDSAVVQLGVDTTVFAPGHREEARRKLGYGDNVPIVLSPRNLSPVYNIDTIIASIPSVLGAVPEARYIIKYGGDSSREVEFRHIAEKLGVGGAVDFMGYSEVATLADYYAAADVCVSVASSDSSPKSVLEAMACGTPVVLSDLPWVHEYIENGKHALLVASRDVEATAQATVRLLTDSQLRSDIGEAAREVVVQHADYRRSMAQMSELYSALVARIMIPPKHQA